MKDLTEGSILGHVLRMSGMALIGMCVQTLYFLTDLYFVARLGAHAIAGVGAAANITFVVIALTQTLGVGTLALVSHAVGRTDQDDANRVFNQSLALSALVGTVVISAGYLLSDQYLRAIGADEAVHQSGVTYIYWFLPGLALQFAMVSMGAALRGTGVVRPTMIIQVLTVFLNVLLAPALIAGWGTGHALGVAGAALASTIAAGLGAYMLFRYFRRFARYITIQPTIWKPDYRCWRRILSIGLPAGGEFFVMFLVMGLLYWLIRPFGPEAQAGYGVGSRVLQAIFLPAMAVAFSAAPIAGQNFGARKADRVRETFRIAVLVEVISMLGATLLCQLSPEFLIKAFTADVKVVEIGTNFLLAVSWSFIASGIIFTCSGMFQGMGNTWPALISSTSRLFVFCIPALVLSKQVSFALEQLWQAWVITLLLQATISYALLKYEMRRSLAFADTFPTTA